MNELQASLNEVDEEFCELVDGQLVAKSMWAGTQFVVSEIAGFLGSHVREHRLGWSIIEAKFSLPHTSNHRIPAVAFVSYVQWPRAKTLPNGPVWEVAPDLAVDVVGPIDNATYLMGKIADYLRAGCKAVWIIWPSLEQIHVYDSPKSVKIYSQTDTLEGDPVIPGFRLPLIELFPIYDDEPVSP